MEGRRVVKGLDRSFRDGIFNQEGIPTVQVLSLDEDEVGETVSSDLNEAEVEGGYV